MSNASTTTSTKHSTSDAELECFQERLKSIIGDQSLREFAKKIDSSEGNVRTLLKGSQPRLDTLLRIAKEGRVNVHWLATGEGDKTPPPEGDKVAERLSHIKVGEDGAVYTRSSITTELKDRLKRYKRVYNEAVTAVGWQPPPAVAAAIQTMIFTEPVEIDQVVLLLEALKTEYS